MRVMATFSFKNALSSIVNAAKNAVSSIVPKPTPQPAYKAPSSSFINTVVSPAKVLASPVPKPTYSTPNPLPQLPISSTQNPLTSNRSNPLTLNKPNIQNSSTQNNGNWMKSVGNSVLGAGNWIDQNVKSGSGSKVGEAINAIGQFGGYFKDGGTTAPLGKYSAVPTPKFDFSSALQGVGNYLVKKASASDYGSGSSANTPTGSFLVDKNSSRPDSSLIAPKSTDRPAPYAVASLGNGQVKYSDGSVKTEDNTIYNSAKNNYDKFSAETPTNLNTAQDAYVALNDQVNGIMNEYNNGNMTAEEAQQKMADAQKLYLNAQYNANKENALALIPQYETFRDKAVNDINSNLSEIKTNADKTKATTSNTYGDILRRATENKKYTDATRRNQFSSLGTADSSAFIESQQRADSQAGSDSQTTEREMADKLANIDTEVTKAEKSAMEQKNTIVLDAQTKIDQVKRDINASDEEKRAKIEEIAANLATNVASLAQDLSDKKAALLSTQLSLSGNLQAIREQGNVDLNTQRAIYNMTNSGTGNTVPADLQSQLDGFLKSPSSGYNSKLKKQQLQQQYPTYADLIERVFNPTA